MYDQSATEVNGVVQLTKGATDGIICRPLVKPRVKYVNCFREFVMKYIDVDIPWQLVIDVQCFCDNSKPVHWSLKF